MKSLERMLEIGEVVVLLDHLGSVAGHIVERLDRDYVRVKWADLPVPTIHRELSLRRIGGKRRAAA